jgi:hypothetical protein
VHFKSPQAFLWKKTTTTTKTNKKLSLGNPYIPEPTAKLKKNKNN